MNSDSFFKFQSESRINNSRKIDNRAYPISTSSTGWHQIKPVHHSLCISFPLARKNGSI